MWCVPAINEEFIDGMEDVLSLYARPYDEKEPERYSSSIFSFASSKANVRLPSSTARSRAPAEGALHDSIIWRSRGAGEGRSRRSRWPAEPPRPRRRSRPAYLMTWQAEAGLPNCT